MPMQPMDNPLPPEQIESLREARACCNRADSSIEKLSACGVDCRGERALSEALKERIDRFLEYFGGERQRR